MQQSHIATAADYADAMMTARRAKHWLFFLLLIALLAQLALFFVARYTEHVLPAGSGATTQASDSSQYISSAIRYFVGLTTFIGVVVPPVLAAVLLLITIIMLVGRLIGVSRVISALIWCLVLAVLLFPWQAFLYGVDWKLPGVLYTWNDLQHARFDSNTIGSEVILRWARFVAFPLVALFILLAINSKVNRGLRMALGEDAIDVAEGGTGVA